MLKLYKRKGFVRPTKGTGIGRVYETHNRKICIHAPTKAVGHFWKDCYTARPLLHGPNGIVKEGRRYVEVI
jgi:hypothetical protein